MLATVGVSSPSYQRARPTRAVAAHVPNGGPIDRARIRRPNPTPDLERRTSLGGP
jgi:hypothetical protein